MTEETVSPRRNFLKLAGGAVAAVALLGSLPSRVWAALPHLTQANASAKALQYVDDDTKSKSPQHKAGEDCSKCVHYQGKAGQAYGPCAIFPGFDVNAKGWCAGFQAKA